MIRKILLAFLMLPVFALAQDLEIEAPMESVIDSVALSVDSETVEVETVIKSIEQRSVVFGDLELSGSTKVVSSKSTKTSGVLITVSENARSVVAFNTGFDPAIVSMISGKQYLLTGSPGKYLVIVDTANGSIVRPVVIESSGGDFSELAKLSSTLAMQLDDPDTQRAIGRELRSRLDKLGAGSLDGAFAMVQAGVETALSARKGDSRYVDWLNGWRRPIQKQLESFEIDSVEQYQLAMTEVVNGLAEGLVAQAKSKPIKKPTVSKAIVPFSARLPPGWNPPPLPHVAGQVHNGRVCVTEGCNDGSGVCRLVWRKQ